MDRDPSNFYLKSEGLQPNHQQETKQPQQRNWPLYDASDDVSSYTSK